MAESCNEFVPNPWKHHLCRNCTRREDQHVEVLATVDSEPDDEEVAPPAIETSLPPCSYGLACYRTNPQHFECFSHPEGHIRSSSEHKLKKKLESRRKKELRFVSLMEEHCSGLLGRLDEKEQEVNNLRKNMSDLTEYQRTLEQSLADATDDHEKHELERQQILAVSRRTPNYWGPNALTQYYREVTIHDGSLEFEVINGSLNSTISTHENLYGTVNGRDPTEFAVTRLTRILSMNLWHEYCYKKETIMSKNAHNLPNCDSSKYLQACPLLTPLLSEQANEYWLFHGCSDRIVPQLVQDGYDPRVSSLKGMFGGGFYLAENSSKSNQYIPCPRCEKNAIGTSPGCTCLEQGKIKFTMILYRAVLGDVHIAQKYDPAKYRRTEDRRGKSSYVRRPPAKSNGMTLYDSVMGESREHGGDRLRHREFVLYERGQAYPEYVIDFHRSVTAGNPSNDIELLKEKCRHFLRNTFRLLPE